MRHIQGRVDTGFFKGIEGIAGNFGWQSHWGMACPKMLQLENCNVIVNCYTRNTSNAITIQARGKKFF